MAENWCLHIPKAVCEQCEHQDITILWNQEANRSGILIESKT